MISQRECGCTINDERLSTVHEADGRHYPIGTSPETFCKTCDQYHPAVTCKWDKQAREKRLEAAGPRAKS